MSSVKSPVVLNILDKEYRIACPKGEEDSLQASAHLLNVRIQEIRDGGKVMGPDRMAVMAALNLAHDLLLQKVDWIIRAKISLPGFAAFRNGLIPP